MTRIEVLRKIREARIAIQACSDTEAMERADTSGDQRDVEDIFRESQKLMSEVRMFIGASGNVCPECHGSGRV